jgi:GMP synthase-like glutamine amidotransferase
LLAKALSARVYKNSAKEIGWFDVELTDAGRRDPILSGLDSPETVFHWHGETFDLPDGADWLAYSEHCRHQAFRVGSNTYGLQFHLEVTPEMIADWCRQDENCGDVRELEAPLDPSFNQDRLAALSRLVFGRWCALLK